MYYACNINIFSITLTKSSTRLVRMKCTSLQTLNIVISSKAMVLNIGAKGNSYRAAIQVILLVGFSSRSLKIRRFSVVLH